MPVRPIVSDLESQSPILNAPVKTVAANPDREILLRLVGDLKDTMMAHPICVGLAANQIGVPVAVAIVGVTRSAEDIDVLINPKILEHSGSDVKRESCMSIPGKTQDVKRSKKVRVKFLDIDGMEHERVLEGFEARAWQHEIDHLSGVLYAKSPGVRGEPLDSAAFDYELPDSIPYGASDRLSFDTLAATA